MMDRVWFVKMTEKNRSTNVKKEGKISVFKAVIHNNKRDTGGYAG